MAYRDEREAILLRVRALSAELSSAHDEIDSLKRKLRGEPAPEPGKSGRNSADASASEIIAELASARALLAGLIGEEEARPVGETPHKKPRDPVLEALRTALRTSLVRKLGKIDDRVRAAIDDISIAEDLIDLIASVAVAADRKSTRALFH